MTRLLHDVLREQADAVAAPAVDLDAVIRSGDRRVTRRRLAGGLAAAAVAASIAGTAAGLSAVQPRADGPVAAPPSSAAFAQRQPGYALGPVIHAGARSWRMSRPVRSYVQTDDGFVWTSNDGTVWFFDGSDTKRLGSTSNGRLRADDTGSLVAWVGTTEAGRTQYVVYDTARLAEVARVDDQAAGSSKQASDEGAEVFALDDGAVYWRADADRMVRYDVASGDTALVHDPVEVDEPADKPARVLTITDVADGRIAFVRDGRDGTTVLVGDAVDSRATPVTPGSSGDLSPDGRYLMPEGDRFSVYDTVDGSWVSLDRDPGAYRTGLGWLDEDTVLVLVFADLRDDATQARLETCHVGSRACDDAGAVDFPAEAPESFVAPTGNPST